MKKIITLLILSASMSTLNCMEESDEVWVKKVRCMAHHWHPLIADILTGEVSLKVEKEYRLPCAIEYDGHQRMARPIFFNYTLSAGDTRFLFRVDRDYGRDAAPERVSSFFQQLAKLPVEGRPACVQKDIIKIAEKHIPKLRPNPKKLNANLYAETFVTKFEQYENYILSRLQKRDPSLFDPARLVRAKNSSGKLQRFELME